MLADTVALARNGQIDPGSIPRPVRDCDDTRLPITAMHVAMVKRVSSQRFETGLLMKMARHWPELDADQ